MLEVQDASSNTLAQELLMNLENGLLPLMAVQGKLSRQTKLYPMSPNIFISVIRKELTPKKP